MRERVILHCDLNNFYASVECVLHPELKGLPIAVCGDPEKRHGIVLAKNNLAKAAGVKTAEAIWQAKRKCPELVVVPPTYSEYVKYSKLVKNIYLSYTSEVESFGLDECWLDVTGSGKLFGTGTEIAESIRKRVKEETGGLTVSIGVSFNKIFAKLGSDLKKPDAITEINRLNYKEVVWRLNVGEMLYIGGATAEKLRTLGIGSIGELASANPSMIERHFGKNGLKMLENARGENSEPVKSYYDKSLPESVGHGMTTPEDVRSVKEAEKVIYALSEMTAFRLRSYSLKGSTVSVDLRSSDLKHLTRQGKTPSVTDSADMIAETAIGLMNASYNFKTMPPLRTITISVSKLYSSGDLIQGSLFDEDDSKNSKLDKSIDNLRTRFGFGVVKRGVNLDNENSPKTDDDDFLPFDRRGGRPDDKE